MPLASDRARGLGAFAVLLVLAGSPACGAVIYHEDPITADETWPGAGTVHVVGWLPISAGATLTIQPGAIVKLQPNGFIRVDGCLRALGTSGSPVYFTSLRDDALGGDSNADGAATAPARGDWGAISFTATATDYTGGGAGCVLRYCKLRYGGFYVGGSPMLQSWSAAPGILNCELQQSAYSGLRIDGPATPLVQDTVFHHCSEAAVTFGQAGPARLSNCRAHHCGTNGICIDYSSLTGSIHWTKCGLAWVVRTATTIEPGATLTLNAGTVVKLLLNRYLEVKGTLRGLGTAASPVTITSVKDDTAAPPGDPAAGDTNGDGTASAPGAGDWSGIWFRGSAVDYDTGSGAGSLLKYCNARYGGNYFNAGDYVFACVDCSPGLIRCTAVHCHGSAVYMGGTARPYLESCVFHHITGPAIYQHDPVTPRLVDCRVYRCGGNGIQVGYSTIPQNVSWLDCGLAWIVLTDVTVQAGATLTIQAGAVVKLLSNDRLIVEGTLRALGTVGKPIVLTSYRDDSGVPTGDAAGGDTNNDGAASSPACGDWGGVYFADSAVDYVPATRAGSRLEYCHVRYAGFFLGGMPGAYCYQSAPSVRLCRFEHNASAGLKCYGAGARVTSENNLFDDCGNGLVIEAAPAVVRNNTIHGTTAESLLCTNASPMVRNCILMGGTYGVRATDGAAPLVRFCDVYAASIANYGGMADPTGSFGNISRNPRFAAAGAGDFHLKSTGGRYVPATDTWVVDAVHSPAIDAGHPADAYAAETAPNGGRINMGAYGNTAQASRAAPPGPPVALLSGLAALPTAAGAQVRFALSAEGTVTASVHSLAGRVVRVLCRGRVYEAGVRTLLWDGRADRGVVVPAGVYMVEVVARTADGAEQRRAAACRVRR